MNSEIKFYSMIFLRRLPLFLFVFLAFSAIGATLAVMLPTVYRSNARLLVEPPQVPPTLAKSTFVGPNAQEQLDVIQQRLLTRANLIEIANDLDVFEDIENMNPDDVVTQMRANTSMSSAAGKNKALIMRVAFDARSPQIASRVVNEYVTRVLDDNVRQRTGSTGDTLEFFKQEVERLGRELDVRSERILEFQDKNADALPSNLSFKMNRQSALQQQIAQNERDKDLLDDQRAKLIELYNSTGQIQSVAGTAKTPEQIQLDNLRKNLSAALAIYSETSPKVTIIKSQIAQLETIVAEQGSASLGVQGGTILDVQLADIDGKLQYLVEQNELLQEELDNLTDAINRTPANSIALQALQREYNNIQGQYNNAVSDLSQAATGERIELLSKGERIVVLEQATAPTSPSSPNRPIIAGAGIAGGIGAGAMLIALLEFFNKAVRRPAELTKGLGIAPLATVPYIRTQREALRRRIIILSILAAILIGIPAILYYVHTSILPLDLLLQQVMSKLPL